MIATVQNKAQTFVGEEWLSPRRFLLLLIAAIVVTFPKVLLGMSTFFFQDFGVLGYPYGAFFRESVMEGQMPFWNPYSHCGVPFMAQWGTMYPPSMLGILLPLPWSANVLTFVHLIWGGMGMYYLMRHWQLGCFAASFAGMAYAFNGVTMSCHVWGNYIASFSWQPWIVLCVMRAWKYGGRWIVLAALTSAMQVLTATPEITLLGWIIIGGLWLAAVAKRRIPLFSSIGKVAAVVLLASMLVMIQMIPFMDLLQNSQRDITIGAKQSAAMAPWGWANLFVPLFHCFQSSRGNWFQAGQHFITSYYLGVGVLVLAITGAWLRRSVTSTVLSCLALFFWIMALGSAGYLYDWITSILPQINIARFQVKYAIPTVFVIPILAAWGVERMADREDRRTRRIVLTIACSVLLVMGGLMWFAYKYPFPLDDVPATLWNAGSRIAIMALMIGGLIALPRIPVGKWRWLAQTGLIALLPLDAITHVPDITPTLPRSFLAPGMWEASGKPPPPKLGEGRIMLSQHAERLILYSVVTNLQADFTGKRLAEWSNLNLVDRIPKVSGAMTLRPAHFDKIEHFIYLTPGSQFGPGLADFLSAKWVSAPENPVLWIERTNHLPVISAGQKPLFATDSDVLTNITAMDFDPRAVVYLPDDAKGSISITNRSAIRIERAEFGLNEVEAELSAAEPGMVVLSQSYYPHWKAYLNGEQIPLHRANLAFQAVQVPSGQHVLRIEYRDPNFLIGGAISILGLFMCAVIWKSSRSLTSQPPQDLA